jgi:hypothetical protein
MGPFRGDDSLDDKILIGAAGPIPITVDTSPSAPAWMKILEINRDGQGWSPTGPLSMVNIMEFIVIQPSSTSTQPIVDWHEDIDPNFGDGANFKWAGGAIDIPGLGSFPGMVSPDGKSIWFDFPPLQPGVPFMINKDLMWNGPVITPGQNGTNNYVVKINERPSIPEPSALYGLTAGLLGLAWLSRRRISR